MKKYKILRSNNPVEKEIIELVRELIHAILLSSVTSWIDLQLTLPQLRTIFIIAHNKKSNVKCISKQLGVGESTTSHLIDKLVQSGLVDRRDDPVDRRRAIVQLTKKSERITDKLLGWEVFLNGWLHKISNKERSDLCKSLKAVVSKYRMNIYQI